MMDELDVLKKDWQQREQNNPRLSYNDIYKMLYKRSTSIVKWIFIISILELLLWTGISLFTPKSSLELLEKFGILNLMWGLNIVHYIIFTLFIVLFYKNFKRIQVTDTTHQLMGNILKTRKTVRYFVIYNVAVFALTLLLINIFYFINSEELVEYMSGLYGTEIHAESDFLLYFFVIQLIVGVVMILLLLLFYRVVYGILLKKLHKNYKELERIEV